MIDHTSWCLTEELLQRLRVFHAQCLRAMSRVSRKHAWEHHISSMQLMQELGLDAIDFYVARRQLRWLGHVSRMGWERLPRRMLSAWVPHARPRGAPRLTYGRSVAKAMDVFNLDHARWPELLLTARAGGRCCRAGRRRRRFASRPRPRRPCLCPIRGGAHQRRHRRVAASGGADHAPRQDEENLMGWHMPTPPTPLGSEIPLRTH